jgi:hypothetical protein
MPHPLEVSFKNDCFLGKTTPKNRKAIVTTLSGLLSMGITRILVSDYIAAEQIVALTTDLLAKLRRFPVLLKGHCSGMTPHLAFFPEGRRLKSEER